MNLLAPVLGTPLTLLPELLDRFPELGAARFRRGGILVHIGGWCLGIRSVAAITLGTTVWVARDAALDAELLLHEVRHVQQFAEIRWFPVLYAWESLRRGYRANRYELDAIAFVRRWLHSASG